MHSYIETLYSFQDQNNNGSVSFLENLNIPKLSQDGKNCLDQPISKNELYNCFSCFNEK